MVRKILLATLLGFGFWSPLALAPTAKAHFFHRRCKCFKVYYRACRCDPWICLGTFDCRREARRAVRDMRCKGFEAYFC